MRRLGVIIPAWNAQGTLSETIESVRRQTTERWAMIVIDDGSTDSTAAIAEQHALEDSRIRVVGQSNGGLSNARNTGLRELPSDCSRVLYLDADDLLEVDALEVLDNALDQYADAVGAYGFPRWISEQGDLVETTIQKSFGHTRWAVSGRRLRKLELDAPTAFETFVIWTPIITAGQVLIDRQSLDRAGAWRDMPGEDWEMWLRLALVGDFRTVQQFTLRKRWVTNSLSSDVKWLAGGEPIIRQWLTTLSKERRRTARWGELYCCLLKVDWARGPIREGKIGQGAKQILRAARAGGIFVQRWMIRRHPYHA